MPKGLAGQTFQTQRSGLAMVLLLVARLLWHRYRCRLSHSVWRRPARNPVVGTWLKSIPFRLQTVWHSLSNAIDSDDSIKEIGGCFNHMQDKREASTQKRNHASPTASSGCEQMCPLSVERKVR